MENLVTVVDPANRPLCYMPLAEAAQQNLVWRTVAIFITALAEECIFRWETPLKIGLPLFVPLPAFADASQFCLEKLSALPGLEDMPLKKSGVYKPCPENGNTFTTLYTGRCIKFRDNPHSEFFLADKAELFGLQEAGCVIHPLLALILEKIK